MPDPAKQTDGENNAEEVLYLSPEDERANVVTHGLGIVLSVAAGIFFWQATQTADAGLRTCCFLFCLSMAIVYLFSTLSHAVEEPNRRNRLRAWDQGTIYFLIVGTYSPFVWEGTSGNWRWCLLVGIWIVAAIGFYSKVFASHRINAVTTITYLALGWLPAIPLIPTTPWICILWMLLGGLSYSIGVVFLNLSSRIRYSHAVWHMMVIVGSACHAYAIKLLL